MLPVVMCVVASDVVVVSDMVLVVVLVGGVGRGYLFALGAVQRIVWDRGLLNGCETAFISATDRGVGFHDERHAVQETGLCA